MNFWKIQQATKKRKNYPACNELIIDGDFQFSTNNTY